MGIRRLSSLTSICIILILNAGPKISLDHLYWRYRSMGSRHCQDFRVCDPLFLVLRPRKFRLWQYIVYIIICDNYKPNQHEASLFRCNFWCWSSLCLHGYHKGICYCRLCDIVGYTCPQIANENCYANLQLCSCWWYCHLEWHWEQHRLCSNSSHLKCFNFGCKVHINIRCY